MSISNPSKLRNPPPPVETARDERWQGGDGAGWFKLSGAAAGMIGPSGLAYGVIGALVLAVCLVNAFSAADDAVRHGRAYRLDLPLFYEGTSALVTLVLLPLIRRGVAAIRAGHSWSGRALTAATLGLLFAAAHIVGMVALRKLGCWAVGSAYVFDVAAEVPYEIRKDLATALLIGLACWVADRPRVVDRAAAPLAGPEAGPNPLLWLRDGASQIRIDVREVIWVASAGNYVEYALANRRHLVRGTLAGEEARLSAFGVVRVHRTRLLNLAHAVGLEPRPSGDFVVRMDTGELLAGSRRYRNAVHRLRCSEASGDLGTAS